MNSKGADIVRHLRLISTATAIGMAAAVNLAAQAPTGTTGAAAAPAATAALVDAQGRSIGEARFQATPNGVLLKLDLKNAAPGVHAMHIHAVGKCDAPGFTSAGSHLSAGGKQHGFLNSSGPHTGDLPNIEVPSSGQLSVEHHVASLKLDSGVNSLLDADGSALVIHAAKDDYATDPAGASGDRIACGLLKK